MRQGGPAGRITQSVAAGAVALAAAGLLSKGLSAVARVLVARWLGAEAVGLYEMAAPVLAMGISLCGLGLPVAASALIAGALGRGDRRAALGLLARTRLLLFGAGVLAAVAVGVFAPRLAAVLGNPAAVQPLRAVAPAIPLAVLLAGEKSWLQASGRVAASAWVLTVEQAARVTAALWAALAFANVALVSPAAAARAVAYSPGLGAIGGLLCCVLFVFSPVRVPGAAEADPAAPPPPPPPAGVWALLRGGLPNWLSGASSSLTTAMDVPLITWRLRAAGLGDYASTAALGALNGMAMPLAAGPSVLFGALGSALLPAVASDWARGRRRAFRRRAEEAYFWVLALAVPCAVALWQLSEPLSLLLYRNRAAAAPLGVLAFISVPLGLSYVAAAVVNAVGRPTALLPGAFGGAAVKSGLVVLLTTRFGIAGAACGTVAGFVISATLNVRAAEGLAQCRPPWAGWGAVTAPAVAAQVLACGAGWHALGAIDLPLRLCGTGLLGAGAYAAAFGVAWRALRVRLGLPARLPLGPARG